jgi:hypothetical protein
MRAKMSISNLSVPVDKIQNIGGANSTGQAGHSFMLSFQVKVQPRSLGTLGVLSGEGIDCPNLEWNERIEWFEFDRAAKEWTIKAPKSANMYQLNPNSNTFKNWHSFRYLIATDPSNHPPSELAALKDDKLAKHWIAKHGFTWNLSIRDVPAMGVLGGSGGGGGASLVTGDTRRRVIYFDLGFSGQPERVQLVQILETDRGQLKIHRLIRGHIQKSTVDHPSNLDRWRFQLRSSGARWP